MGRKLAVFRLLPKERFHYINDDEETSIGDMMRTKELVLGLLLVIILMVAGIASLV